jgi:hypothetical protein
MWPPSTDTKEPDPGFLTAYARRSPRHRGHEPRTWPGLPTRSAMTHGEPVVTREVKEKAVLVTIKADATAVRSTTGFENLVWMSARLDKLPPSLQGLRNATPTVGDVRDRRTGSLGPHERPGTP